MRLAAPRFALAQSALNLLGGIYLPFFPLWLAHNQITPQQTSLILGTGMITRVFVAPFVGIVADAINDRRRVTVIVAAFCVFLFTLLAVFGEGNGFWPIFALTVIGATFHSSLGALIEAQTMRGSQDYGFQYAQVRAVGSFTFLAMTYLGGHLIGAVGIEWLAWMIVAIVGVQVISFLPMPRLKSEIGAPKRAIGPAVSKTLKEAGLLMRQPVFLLFLVAVGAAQAAHSVYYAMGSLNFQRLGYASDTIGLLWSLGVLVEVALFLLAPRYLRHVPVLTLIVLGTLLGALRWFGMSLDLAPLPMAALQVLHAGSFGLVHLGTMGFLARAVPVQLSASAQSLFSMMAYGICTGLATLAAGPLYQAVQGHAYLLSVGLSLVAAGLMLILRRRWHGEVLFEIR